MRLFLNADEKETKRLQADLEKNEGFCPCVIKEAVKDDPNANDYKCMCKEFREQIKRKEAGMCHCGLWGVSFEEDEKK